MYSLGASFSRTTCEYTQWSEMDKFFLHLINILESISVIEFWRNKNITLISLLDGKL